jgi:hypothetical protein
MRERRDRGRTEVAERCRGEDALAVLEEVAAMLAAGSCGSGASMTPLMPNRAEQPAGEAERREPGAGPAVTGPGFGPAGGRRDRGR